MKKSIIKHQISALLAVTMLFSSGIAVFADGDETDELPPPPDETEICEDQVFEDESFEDEFIAEDDEEEPLIEDEEQDAEPVEAEAEDTEEVLVEQNGRTYDTTNGIWVYYKDGVIQKGWIKYENTYYYAESDGHLLTSCWATINGKTYYFSWDSTMATGVFYAPEMNGSSYYWFLADSNGACNLKGGWLKLNDYWYYADSQGHLAHYEWKKLGGKWYYFDNSCTMLTGPQMINDSETGSYDYYLFNENGVLQSGGWVKYNNYWYYAGSGSKLAKGWKKIDNKWYYFGSSGTMYTGKTYVYDDNNHPTVYYFDDNGVMQTGWIKLGTSTSTYYYYATSSGALVKGWKKINNKWYYFDDNYRMSDGLCEIDGEYYYFKDGAMKTGWIKIPDTTNYLYADSSGALYRNKWLKSGGKWYYFGDTCYMVKGYKYIDGKRYRFGSDGALIS